MRSLWTALATAVVVSGAARGAYAQSAFTLCADTLPNRIVSTGPARVVIATVDSLRVCLAAEGFSDSAAMHPRDWPNPARLLVLETRVPGDVRRMQESRILTSWVRNERPLSTDSTANAWRESVIDLVAAKWDAAARGMERQELEQTIAGLLAQKKWILTQIDTLRHKEDSLRLEVSEGLSRARMDKQRSVSAATKSESAARSRLSRAQRSLAAAAASDEPGRAQSAREAVSAAEAAVRSASERVRAAQAIEPAAAVAEPQRLLFQLEAPARIATLNTMLADLDVDNRVATMTAARLAIDAQPDPEERLRLAAARLRSILAR